MHPRLKFVSPAAYKKMLQDQQDVKDYGILKSAPVVDLKAINRDARTIDFIISTEAVDRDNDTIAIGGWDISNYLSNPVVLFAHDHWQPPVARAQSVTSQTGALMSRAEFTPKELYPFGDMIFEFYAQGFMRATSVGFKPGEWKFNDDRKFGVDFLKQELLEYSCVPVPSNPEALMQARAKGIDVNPLKAWCERLLDDQRLLKDSGIGSSRQVIERIRELTIDGKSLMVHLGDMKMPHDAPVVVPAPAPDKTVKVLQQWGCKDATHVHKTEDEATRCELQSDVLRSLMPVIAHARGVDLKVEADSTDLMTKVGRVLSAANETRLRNAASKGEEMAALIREVLAQLEEQDDEEDDDKSIKTAADDSTEFFVLDKDPNDLDIDEATVRDAVVSTLRAELTTQLNRITGRVD